MTPRTTLVALCLCAFARGLRADDLPVIPAPARALSVALALRADRVAEAFRARGARPLRDRWSDFVRETESRTLTVSLASPRCLGFVAVGRENLGDIDLTASNESGAEVARDGRRDAHPYVRVCPTAPGSLFLTVRAAHGTGEVAVLTLADPPLVPPPLDEVLGVRPTNLFAGARVPRAEVGRDPAALTAADYLARLTAPLRALGYRATGDARSGRLEHQQTTSASVRLDEGRCYVIQGAAGERVDDLDLRVTSPERRPVAQDVGVDARPAVRLCATATGAYGVDVRMFGGGGDWAFEVLEIPGGADHRLGPDVQGVARARSLEVAAEAAHRAMVPAQAAVRGAAWGAAVLPFAATLRAGRCYVFGAAGNEELGAVDLWVSDASGAVLAADTNERERATVYVCARRDQRATVQVRAQGGRGEYVFQAFESGDGAR